MATFTTRPVVMGTRGVVTSGHYLATAAGFRIMEQGGTRAAYPGRVMAEGRISREVIAALERRGHEVIVIDGWANGKALAIRCDRARGVISGAASPRLITGYALGW